MLIEYQIYIARASAWLFFGMQKKKNNRPRAHTPNLA